MFPSMAVKAGITSSGSHILPTAYRKGTWTGDRIKTVEDVPGPTTLGAVHPSFAKPHYVKRPRASFVGPFPSPSDSPFFLVTRAALHYRHDAQRHWELTFTVTVTTDP